MPSKSTPVQYQPYFPLPIPHTHISLVLFTLRRFWMRHIYPKRATHNLLLRGTKHTSLRTLILSTWRSNSDGIRFVVFVTSCERHKGNASNNVHFYNLQNTPLASRPRVFYHLQLHTKRTHLTHQFAHLQAYGCELSAATNIHKKKTLRIQTINISFLLASLEHADKRAATTLWTLHVTRMRILRTRPQILPTDPGWLFGPSPVFYARWHPQVPYLWGNGNGICLPQRQRSPFVSRFGQRFSVLMDIRDYCGSRNLNRPF